MLVVGHKTYRTITSKLYGSTFVEEITIAVSWTARCTVNAEIRNRGYGFFFFGLLAMIFGITLEVVVLILTNRAKSRLEAKKEALIKQDKSTDIIDEESDNVGLMWYLKHRV